MVKIGNFLDRYERIKKPIQFVIYVIIGAAIISTILGVIFRFKSCSKPSVTEAKYFIDDEVNFHDNYQIKITSARTVNQIQILKNKDDTQQTIQEGNYIAIELVLLKKENSNIKEHKLDQDDFKLKDHTGVYIPMNTIMSFFNIDAVDIHIDTDDGGFIRSDANFSRKDCIKDYTWFNKIVTTEPMNLTIYFDMKEKYKVEEEIMVFEVDFYTGKSGYKKGEDIVLVKCTKESDDTN